MGSLLKGTGIVSALTLVSRILGFVRDMLTAQIFGAGSLADAYFVALRIPNLLRSFVAEGAMTSAFVPVFTDELAKGREQARATTRSVAGLLIAITAVLSVVGIVYAPVIVAVFAPGFGAGTDQFSTCTLLTRIMLPFVMCITLVSMLNGALNACGIYGSAAMAQVWMNVILIVGACLAFTVEPSIGIYFLAVSFVAGGVIAVCTQAPALRKCGLSIKPAWPLLTPATKLMLTLMMPAILGATIYQLQIFINTMLASLLEPGSVSWLFFADRVVQLPIGIYSIALASVLLPSLAAARSAKDSQGFSRDLVNSLRYSSFILFPVSVGLACLAQPLVEILFERGSFGPRETEKTAQAIQAYALGVWAVSCHSMTVRGLIALKDTRSPTLIGAVTLALTTILSLLLMGPIATSQLGAIPSTVGYVQNLLGSSINLGHAGLALASSISALVSFLLVAILLSRRAAIAWSVFVLSSLRSFLAALLMGLTLIGLVRLNLGAVVTVISGLCIGLLIFAGACAILRSCELRETGALIVKLTKRAKNR